jgi:acetoin utilization protein AcuB
MDMLTIAKIMTPTPVMVDPNASLREVRRLMAEHGIRHVPVVSDDGLVGIVSDRDIQEALPSPADPAQAAEFAAAMDRLTVCDVMVEQVITATPRTPVAEAAQLLTDHKIGCLPVVEAGRLVGIATQTDMLRAFATLLGDLSGAPHLEVAVPDAPGTLRDVSRLFAEVPEEVGSFVMGWTEPASAGQAADRVLVLRFHAGDPEEILRILKRVGVRVLSVRGPETDRAPTGGKR